MTVYGYARISTKRQSLTRQITNILKAHPEIDPKNLIQEKATGTTLNRPNFQKLMKKLKTGDTLVFDSVSRMSRNAEEGFQLYEDLFRAGINLEFIREPYINSDHYRQALSVSLPKLENSELQPLMDGLEKTLLLLAKRQFKEAFGQAEKEVKDLSQRTREGMRASGASEKISKALAGKPRHIPKAEETKALILKHSKDFNGTLKDSELLKLVPCSRNSYYAYKRELKNEKVAE